MIDGEHGFYIDRIFQRGIPYFVQFFDGGLDYFLEFFVTSFGSCEFDGHANGGKQLSNGGNEIETFGAVFLIVSGLIFSRVDHFIEILVDLFFFLGIGRVGHQVFGVGGFSGLDQGFFKMFKGRMFPPVFISDLFFLLVIPDGQGKVYRVGIRTVGLWKVEMGKNPFVFMGFYVFSQFPKYLRDSFLAQGKPEHSRESP